MTRKPTPIQADVLTLLRDGGEVSYDWAVAIVRPTVEAWKYRTLPCASIATMDGLERRGLVARQLRTVAALAGGTKREWLYTLTAAGSEAANAL